MKDEAQKQHVHEHQQHPQPQQQIKLAPWAKTDETHNTDYGHQGQVDASPIHSGLSLTEIQRMEEEMERQARLEKEANDRRERMARAIKEAEEREKKGMRNWAAVGGAASQRSAGPEKV